MADALIRTGQHERVLVCTGESPSRAVRWKVRDRAQFVDAFAATPSPTAAPRCSWRPPRTAGSSTATSPPSPAPGGSGRSRAAVRCTRATPSSPTSAGTAAAEGRLPGDRP
ncbi:hypothetical protein ACFQY7_52730 [Actinomadura luteofluorescens]|uniref:hypothetical protein n=1 Tax=Actinomadura luteofluorescens TaxID=46163 RepID=UPI00362A9923